MAAPAPRPAGCPSCGAPMELGTLEGGRDKVALCLHCKTVVDLPDASGRTFERVSERPGQRVVERVTEWVEHGPGPSRPATDLLDEVRRMTARDASFAGLPPALSPSGSEVYFLNGTRYDSAQAARAALARELPPESVEWILGEIRAAAPLAAPAATSRSASRLESRTEVREFVVASAAGPGSAGRRARPRRAPRRPAALLDRLVDWLLSRG